MLQVLPGDYTDSDGHSHPCACSEVFANRAFFMCLLIKSLEHIVTCPWHMKNLVFIAITPVNTFPEVMTTSHGV